MKLGTPALGFRFFRRVPGERVTRQFRLCPTTGVLQGVLINTRCGTVGIVKKRKTLIMNAIFHTKPLFTGERYVAPLDDPGGALVYTLTAADLHGLAQPQDASADHQAK